ncbi:MAG: glutamine--fructose-6-phosphate transaminase (isomerizing) [Aeromicrobium sp.]
MCGIVAGRTGRSIGPYLIEALGRLEYRGYDSAGIAAADATRHLLTLRTVDRVEDLGHQLAVEPRAWGATHGIGHTRWATHGGVSVRNAHPHADCHRRIAIVHNGVLTNADELRAELQGQGHIFASDVDSEVIAHLVEAQLELHDLHTSVERTVSRLEGSWAVVVLDVRTGGMVAAAHQSPLVIARSDHGDFVASDISAIATWVDEFRVLEDGDVVQVTPTPRWRRRGVPVLATELRPCQVQPDDLTLGRHPDFMSKEIDEQPEVAERVLDAWGTGASGPDLWRSLGLPPFRRVAVLGCGTSLNAGRAIAGILGRVGGVPHQEIIASEAHDAVLEPDTLLIALSQSGETADVLRGLDALGPAGASVLAITNNEHSALGRRADAVMPCHAGTEVGVAASKTFTAQLLTGACVAVSALVAHGRLDPFDAQRLTSDLKRVPELLSQALAASRWSVPPLVEGMAGARGFIFLGRGAATVFADEGALKLKELTYRWAESYPAGELKHGPLALVEEGTPVIVVGDDERLAASIAEVQARGGVITQIGGPSSHIPALGHSTDPYAVAGLPWCGPLESVVALQVLARELAVALGRDVDKPRNLAKSVTVE